MRRYVAQPRVRRRSESWQVIYMDLMTIIMVFFVILWSINQKKDGGFSQTVGDQSVTTVNLPGDVLFASGKTKLTPEGKKVFKKLFNDESVLNFDTSGLVKRLLVIHGHTDSDGPKDDNFALGYFRALAAYREIQGYGEDLADHAVICTHADNTPAQDVPAFEGEMTPAEASLIRDAKSKNRRITIEDKVVNRFGGE
ncbi:MAG: flagellar motor protein MotB [Myxococcota bacterium]